MAIWREDYVEKNPYSRPGIERDSTDGIVMHWTATPGASDEREQQFFDGSDGGGGRYASAALFVDRDSATLILPLNEVGYHANDHACRVPQLKPNANYSSIGIEMCVEKDGTIHPDTIARTEDVAVELCKIYKLNPLTDIFRHFDVTGKNCPAPWVANKSLFDGFKSRVNAKLKAASTAPAPAPAPVVGKTYTVQSGETLYGISKKTGVSVANIKSYNSLTSDTIKVGQVLKLEAAAVTTTPAKPVAPAPVTNKLIPPTGVIKLGERSSQAKQLQICLNAVKFNCGTPDGIFGPKSVDALKRFQSVYANPADGVYGSKTRAALVKLLG